jgi:hypothetical protein
MKYALNHVWRFENWKIAYLAGLLQASIIILIEFVNFLAILTSFTVLDVVMNFLALVVISEFDDFFYCSLRDEPLKELLIDPCFCNLLVIERTSSRRATIELVEHELTKAQLNIVDNEEEKLRKEGLVPKYIY